MDNIAHITGKAPPQYDPNGHARQVFVFIYRHLRKTVF